MNKIKLAERLLELPKLIDIAENDVFAATKALEDAKANLQEQQDGLLTSGAIDGKNAEIRAAQMREETRVELFAVANAEVGVREETRQLNFLNNELKALRSVAHLLGGEVA